MRCSGMRSLGGVWGWPLLTEWRRSIARVVVFLFRLLFYALGSIIYMPYVLLSLSACRASAPINREESGQRSLGSRFYEFYFYFFLVKSVLLEPPSKAAGIDGCGRLSRLSSYFFCLIVVCFCPYIYIYCTWCTFRRGFNMSLDTIDIRVLLES